MGRGTVVGREQELATLEDVLVDVAGGAARACLITGEVGIGKTTLLDQASARARQLGFLVAEACADEVSRYVPFGVLVAALDVRPGKGAEFGRLQELLSPPGLHGGGGDAAMDWRFQVVEAFVDLVERLAEAQPLLLAIDDLPRADAGSLAALQVLARRVVAHPLAVVVTARTPTERDVLAALESDANARAALKLDLEPLDEDHIVSLAANLLEASPGPRLRERLLGARGNPLLVTEFVGAARGEGAVEVRGDQAELTAAATGVGAHDAIVRRLRFLPDPVLETVRVAAVAGHPVLPATVAHVQRRPVAAVVVDCEVAARAGLLVDAPGGRVAFRHELLREVVYEALAASTRQALHREYARVLQADNEDVDAVAHHVERGARQGDREAVEWLRRLAARHAAHDPAAASELLRRALQLDDLSPPDEAEVRAELASVLLWHDLTEAEVEAREALRLSPSLAARTAARLVVAHSLVRRGLWSDYLDEVASFAADVTVAPRERLRLLADSVLFRAWTGDVDAAYRDGEEILAAAIQLGDQAAAVSSEAALAGILAVRGDLTSAADRGRAALRRLRTEGDHEAYRRHVQIPVAHVLQECDSFDEQAAVVADGLAIGAHLGSWQLPLYHLLEGNRLHLSGTSWDDAAAELEAALAVGEQTGTVMGDTWAHGCLALLGVHRGDNVAAARHLADGERSLAVAPQGAHWLVLARATFAERQGRCGEALSDLAGFWDLFEGSGLTLHRRVLGPALARLARAAGDSVRTRTVADALVELADRNHLPGLRAIGLLCQGLADDDETSLLDAVDVGRSAARPLEHAAACEASATAFVERVPSRARDLFREAFDIYDRLGAAASAARCEKALADLGLGGRRPRRAARASSGWESLTSTEIRVSTLVAEGMANAEIAAALHVSRHTVETHLKHVYAKLGIDSRLKLARIADRHSPA